MSTRKRKRSRNYNTELEKCKEQYKTKKIKKKINHNNNNSNNNINILSSQKRQYIDYQKLGIEISILETEINKLTTTLEDIRISNNNNNTENTQSITTILTSIKEKIKNYIETKTKEIIKIEQIVNTNNATIETKCINKIAIRNKLTLMIKYLKTKIKDINSLIENYNNKQMEKKYNNKQKIARNNRIEKRLIRKSLQNLQGFNEEEAFRELGMDEILIGLELPNETKA